MVIQSNNMALNSYRNLGVNSNALATSIERLSSGYRINRAGDDAAGLAISEKMRAQISSLKTAQRNALDGISLIQTAEGALTEIHAMLNHMVELSTQASSGVYDNAIDRNALNDEFQALKEEINRIAHSTNFNGRNLLDGSIANDGRSAAQRAMMATVNLVSDFKDSDGKDMIEVVKGDLVNAVGTEYTIIGNRSMSVSGAPADTPANHGEALLAAMKEEGIDTEDLLEREVVSGTVGPNHRAWSAAIARYYNIEEADYRWDIRFDGDNLNSLEIRFQAKEAGAVDPNRTQILTKGAGLPSISEPGADKYNMVNLVVSGNPDNTLIGKQIEINSKVYTFINTTGGFPGGQTLASAVDDATFVPGVTSVDIAGSRLKDGSYAIDITNLATHIDTAAAQNFVADAIANAIRNAESAGATWDKATGVITVIDESVKDTVADVDAGVANDGLVGVQDGSNILVINPTRFPIRADNNVTGSGGLNLLVGASADEYNMINVSIRDMSTKGLGIAHLNIASYDAATNALGTIAAQGDKGTLKGALNIVSEQRAALGALMNRLEHTVNNLGVTTENLTAAESRIRDTDMAREMINFAKNSILVQAAQAMLAQANMHPGHVIQLLRP
jgi:flagellin